MWLRALLFRFNFNVAGMKFFLKFALFLAAKGANLAEQVGYLFLSLGLHTGQIIQEKGLGVKDRLPLANGAFLSSHAEFGLCGTAALLAAASLSETGFVPKLTAFTGLKSGVKGFGVGGLEAGFGPV